MSDDQQIQKIERDVYVSLKEHFTQLLAALDRRTDQTAKDARLAVEKAEAAQERRLDLLNEFRAQAADESKKYATTASLQEFRESFEARVFKIENQMSRLYGGILVVGAIGVANIVKLWFTG